MKEIKATGKDYECILEVKNLQIGFQIERRQKQVVWGVDFKVRRGQVLTILGESGCGKSVLGAAILKLLPYNAVTKGEVLFLGQEILGLSEKEFRALRGKGIAVAMQGGESGLDPLLKIGKQAIEGIRYHDQISRKEALRQVREMFQTLGLNQIDDILNSYPYQLSGGMNQRVLLGMTALLKPQFLLLDEPTKGLDWQSKQDTAAALEDLKKQTQAGVLLITHDLELTRRMADIILVMYAGQVVEIMKAEYFAKPLHPYTAGLIASAPEGGFLPIRGSAPDAYAMPKGCHFAPRCQKAEQRCLEEMPSLRAQNDRYIRCFKAGVKV